MKTIIEQVKELNAQSWDLCLKIFFITEMLKLEDAPGQRAELQTTKLKLHDIEEKRKILIFEIKK